MLSTIWHLVDACSSLCLTEVAGRSKRVFRNDAIHLIETGSPPDHQNLVRKGIVIDCESHLGVRS